MWGDNSHGQLGINTSDCFSKSPVEVVSLRTYYEAVIVKIVCGKQHVLALSKTGSLYVWGSNKLTQLATLKLPNHEKDCLKEVQVDNVR